MQPERTRCDRGYKQREQGDSSPGGGGGEEAGRRAAGGLRPTACQLRLVAFSQDRNWPQIWRLACDHDSQRSTWVTVRRPADPEGPHQRFSRCPCGVGLLETSQPLHGSGQPSALSLMPRSLSTAPC